jgi:hypothetical protein
MLKKKKEKSPALEVNLNLIPLLESLGIDKILKQAAETAKDGEAGIINKLVTKLQAGEMEVSVSAGGKKTKIPISFVVRLKKKQE